jgi:hypothetical protein
MVALLLPAVVSALAASHGPAPLPPVRPGQWGILKEALQSWSDLSFDADYAVM